MPLKMQTLAQVEASRPRAQPKGGSPSRLERKAKADKDDAVKLAEWRKEIWARDEWTCQCCEIKVRKLPIKVLDPKRGECNHIVSRTDLAVRYDTRNGVLLCLSCHEKVTGKVNERLEIVGTVHFMKAGKRYINADYPVSFKRIA